jgi:DUF4097 and DUF4098 domain-containing protein YvlB
MNTRSPSIMLLAGLALSGALVAAAAQAQATTRVDRRIAAAGASAVTITNVAGDIDVRGWNRAEVQVSGTLGAGVERLDLLRDGNVVAVRVVLPRGGSRTERASAKLVVQVPKDLRLEVSAVSADVRVAGVDGQQDLRTVSGDIVAQGGARDVQIKTVSGEVGFDGRSQPRRLTISTVSGDMELRALAGELEAASISGDVEAGASALKSVNVKTTSGDVTVDGGLVAGASVQVNTVSGDATVSARGAPGLAIEARSFSGALETCFGAQGEPTGRAGPGRRLELKRGDGSIEVRISTVSGEVAICDR